MNAPTAKYLFRKITDEKHSDHASKQNYLLPTSPVSAKRHVIDESNIGMLTLVKGVPKKTIFYYTNKSNKLKNYTYDLTTPV